VLLLLLHGAYFVLLLLLSAAAAYVPGACAPVIIPMMIPDTEFSQRLENSELWMAS
jgi:hypothetical protein